MQNLTKEEKQFVEYIANRMLEDEKIMQMAKVNSKENFKLALDEDYNDIVLDTLERSNQVISAYAEHKTGCKISA